LFHSVDAAIIKNIPVAPRMACMLYAALGCLGANFLAASRENFAPPEPHYYKFYAGTSRLRINSQISWDRVAHHPSQYKLIGIPETPESFQFLDPERTSSDYEFHCWFGAISERENREFEYLEAVDFTAQFFKPLVLEGGLAWEREDVPEFIWTDQKGLGKMQYELWILNGYERVLLDQIQQMPTFYLAWRDVKADLQTLRPGQV
jgi:hypothetical protein